MSATSNLNAAITLLLNLTAAAGKVSALIAQARSEGREELTTEEMAGLRATDDAARADLVGAIDAANAQGSSG